VDWIRFVGCGVVDDKGRRRIDIARPLWFFCRFGMSAARVVFLSSRTKIRGVFRVILPVEG
jgi:hypothetical protein